MPKRVDGFYYRYVAKEKLKKLSKAIIHARLKEKETRE